MKNNHTFKQKTWLGFFLLTFLLVALVAWQNSISRKLVFEQTDQGFAVNTGAGNLHLQRGQINHADWSMFFSPQSKPQQADKAVLYEGIQPGVDLRWYDKGDQMVGHD